MSLIADSVDEFWSRWADEDQDDRRNDGPV